MGCEWIGEYGKVEKHLDFDNDKGECQFVAVKCPLSQKCECTILRKFLATHCKKACKYRPYSCKYCGFQSTYVEITTQHNGDCVNYPLLCPNHCSRMTYPRHQLKEHIAECPDEKVSCTFSEMGCKELIKRRLLQRHLEYNAVYHQTIMCQTFNRQIKSLVDDKQSLVHDKEMLERKLEAQNETIQALEEKVSHLSSEMESLKMKSKSVSSDEYKPSLGEECSIKTLRDIASKLRETNWPLHLSRMVEISAIQPFVPVIFKVPFTITKEHRAPWSRVYKPADKRNHYNSAVYYCSPFYTRPNGHKLQLSAKIKCHCGGCSDYDYCESSRKDKLSLSIDVHVVESKYDSQLKWPFNRTIAVTLLNEETNYNHHTVNQKCYCTSPTKLHVAAPQGEAPQQPDARMYGWSVDYLESQAQEQQKLHKHHDFMIFPFDVKGNFLQNKEKSPVYRGNYIGEHQTYVYIQVKL